MEKCNAVLLSPASFGRTVVRDGIVWHHCSRAARYMVGDAHGPIEALCFQHAACVLRTTPDTTARSVASGQDVSSFMRPAPCAGCGKVRCTSWCLEPCGCGCGLTQAQCDSM